MSYFLPYPGQRGGGVGGPTKILLESAGDPYPLVGLRNHIQLPAPPAGKVYQDITFSLIGAISDNDTTPTQASDLSEYCRSLGRYIVDGENASAFYECLDYNGVWYSGLDETGTAGWWTVGVFPRSAYPGTAYTIIYNPINHRLMIGDGTTGRGTRLAATDPPVIDSALVTSNII